MTIEQIRQLPEDNWLEIKRLGEHFWQIGSGKEGGNSLIMCTGDGGVVEYTNTLFETMRKPLDNEFFKGLYGKGLIESSNTEHLTYEDLSYERLKKIVEEMLYGVAKD